MKRRLVSLALLTLILLMAACTKTTFNKVGAIIAGAVSFSSNEIDGLLAQGRISQDAHDKAAKKIAALGRAATNYNAQIAKFPAINRQNVGAVVAATEGLLKEIRATLTDPDLVNLGPGNKVVKYLSYAVDVAEASKDAIAVLFPGSPPGAVTAAASPAIGQVDRSYSQSKIEVKLPPKPAGL